MEWFQFDYIEIGNYEVTEDFTVEAKLFGRKKIVGIFNPETNLLNFRALLETSEIIDEAYWKER
jgi:hypothetical protein